MYGILMRNQNMSKSYISIRELSSISFMRSYMHNTSIDARFRIILKLIYSIHCKIMDMRDVIFICNYNLIIIILI